MLLAHLLLELNIDYHLIHINYGWRKEADEDQAWLEKWAEKHRVPIQSFRAQPKSVLLNQYPGKSAQEVARIIRYQYFSSVIESYQEGWVLTAHHQGDQRETLLMRIFEGRSVKPIPAIRKPFLRPLLSLEPDVLNQLREALKVEWREDSSNASLDYRRNQFRNQVIPQLNQLGFNWKSGFDSFVQHHISALNSQQLYLDGLRQNVIVENGLTALPLKLVSENNHCLSYLLRAFNLNFSEHQLELIEQLLHTQKGKKILLANGILWKEKRSLVFVPYHIKTSNIINYPTDIKYDLKRSWQSGDSLKKPDGHHRKIKDWLNDHSLPSFLKSEFQVFFLESTLIWPHYHSKIDYQLTSAFLELVS